MHNTTQITVTLPQPLLEQAEALAQQLGIRQDQLITHALQHLVDQQQITQADSNRRVINQGDIYWVTHENPNDPQNAIPHPYVVVQENLFNHSRISTVIACALTSNIRRTSDTPGNILLDVGEGNLPKQSVVEISKVSSIEKSRLGDYVGRLSEARMAQIWQGMRFLYTSFLNR